MSIEVYEELVSRFDVYRLISSQKIGNLPKSKVEIAQKH